MVASPRGPEPQSTSLCRSKMDQRKTWVSSSAAPNSVLPKELCHLVVGHGFPPVWIDLLNQTSGGSKYSRGRRDFHEFCFHVLGLCLYHIARICCSQLIAIAKLSRAASTVRSISASVCAVETKSASNWEGGK